MRLFEVRSPFFRPMWRRVVATVVCLGWAAFELYNGSVLWAALFGAGGAILFWQFFVTFEDGPALAAEKDLADKLAEEKDKP